MEPEISSNLLNAFEKRFEAFEEKEILKGKEIGIGIFLGSGIFQQKRKNIYT